MSQTAVRRMSLQTERPSPGGTVTARTFTPKSLSVRTKLQASLRRLALECAVLRAGNSAEP